MNLFLTFLFRQDLAQNPPLVPAQTMPPRATPSAVQQGAVDVAADLMPPLPQMAASQQGPAGLGQQQGNPGANPQQASGPPAVMTLNDLQRYFIRQGYRLQFSKPN